MKIIRFFFLSENFQCLVVKFSIYLNRRVFVIEAKLPTITGLTSTHAVFRRISEFIDKVAIKFRFGQAF